MHINIKNIQNIDISIERLNNMPRLTELSAIPPRYRTSSRSP